MNTFGVPHLTTRYRGPTRPSADLLTSDTPIQTRPSVKNLLSGELLKVPHITLPNITNKKSANNNVVDESEAAGRKEKTGTPDDVQHLGEGQGQVGSRGAEMHRFGSLPRTTAENSAGSRSGLALFSRELRRQPYCSGGCEVVSGIRE